MLAFEKKQKDVIRVDTMVICIVLGGKLVESWKAYNLLLTL